MAVITTPSPSTCLNILCPKDISSIPPPILFLIPLSPPLIAPMTLRESSVNTLDSDTDTQSPRSSTSHRKHPQSSSSDKSSCFGPEFLQILDSSPIGTVHIVPVAVCQKGEVWSKEGLARLLDMGIRDILSVPCEPASVGGLFMVRHPCPPPFVPHSHFKSSFMFPSTMSPVPWLMTAHARPLLKSFGGKHRTPPLPKDTIIHRTPPQQIRLLDPR